MNFRQFCTETGFAAETISIDRNEDSWYLVQLLITDADGKGKSCDNFSVKGRVETPSSCLLDCAYFSPKMHEETTFAVVDKSGFLDGKGSRV